MHYPRQFLGTVVMCLTLLVALSGCIRLDRDVQLQGDGSGTFTTVVGFSSQLLAFDTTGSIKQAFATCGNTFKTKGGSYRNYDNGDYSYWSFSLHFKTIADLNNLLQGKGGLGDCNLNSSSSTSTPTVSTDTFNVTQQSNFFSNTFHVTGHISFKSTTPSTNDGGSSAALLASARETFAVTMPSISTHKGGTQANNTVTYTLHYGDESDIDVTGSGTTAAAGFTFAGGAVIVLLAGAGAAFWFLRRRSASAGAVPSPVASTPIPPLDVPLV